jgi:hypothetical protein
MNTPIQPDLGPANPPNNVGEEPFLIAIRYELENLFYAAGMKLGTESLDGVMPWMDGLNFVVQEALHNAKQRLREPSQHTPIGIRIDTGGMGPLRDDDPRECGQ